MRAARGKITCATAKKKMAEENPCIICWDPIGSKGGEKKLECGHAYCEKCIYDWYKVQMTCPICFKTIFLPIWREIANHFQWLLIFALGVGSFVMAIHLYDAKIEDSLRCRLSFHKAESPDIIKFLFRQFIWPFANIIGCPCWNYIEYPPCTESWMERGCEKSFLILFLSIYSMGFLRTCISFIAANRGILKAYIIFISKMFNEIRESCASFYQKFLCSLK